MPEIDQNILKKLKRKYPGLPVVGSPKDWERIEKMLSKDDLKLYKYHNILDKTINWLDGEVTESQEVIDEYMKDERPKCTDGTDDMIEGRYECANSLLEQIQKWENEES